MTSNSQDTHTNRSQTVTLPETSQLLQLRADQSDQVPKLSKKEQKSKVTWDRNVIDNEHMNKKKTKICCIFHPQQNYDEEEETGGDHQPASSSSTSSSSENDDGMDFEARRKARLERRLHKLEQKKPSSPNAYEVQPDYRQYRQKFLHENK
ncbi:type 1 protein phosphatase-activating protein YPI1 Ecym_7332 [Eremothecium cymbalariae DBVPG|uniref:Type 1 phosphatases regulator n=1 Tax=Eremothecium cymbalariae (strain CBS 270.75 / DBVPG 7215 / KCTC 17166 / NRRL Y-17582) TaxID=931890 RepID=G8JWE9_ERECY|nr:hypothetical protein Ecym_7332 [Eremothecium cymbalariae DBVPG\